MWILWLSILKDVCLLCATFVGDPYFVEYLEPHTAYNMIIRAMSEVGDGLPLTYVVTTPDVCKCAWHYTDIIPNQLYDLFKFAFVQSYGSVFKLFVIILYLVHYEWLTRLATWLAWNAYVNLGISYHTV